MDGSASSLFDDLPDPVAGLILSKLSNARAVARASAVCKRWRSLCRSVEALAFESFKLLEDGTSSRASRLESIVSAMLLWTTGVRELSICYHPVVWPWIPDDHFSCDKVRTWLDHVKLSLEKLVLVDPSRSSPNPDKLLGLAACKRLRWLNLCYGFIPEVPPGLPPMDSLKVCVLDLVCINDQALESLVRLCPSLEELRVNSCKGLRSPTLVAPRLVKLEFIYEMDICYSTIRRLSVQAPRLSHLSLSCVDELITDGEALLELGLLCHVRPRIRDLSFLAELNMKGQVWHLDSILQLVKLGFNVKQLYVDTVIDNKSPIQLGCFFQHLPSLKTVYVGADMFECMQAGAAGSTLQNICLPMLEDITAVVRQGNKACITVLLALLKCSSSLRTLTISAQELESGAGNVTFFSDLLALQREFPLVKMSLECPKNCTAPCCKYTKRLCDALVKKFTPSVLRSSTRRPYRLPLLLVLPFSMSYSLSKFKLDLIAVQVSSY